MIRFLLALFIVAVQPHISFSQEERYDLSYIWDTSLDNVLDYEATLSELLSAKESRKLRIVGRKGGEYGLIYDLDGSALDSARLMVKHGELLRTEGLGECTAIEDQGYFRLYNVSYGLGPNLDALKTLYGRIYSYLGKEVGKNLYIEKTDSNNYTLIYRRRGDRSSTYSVARKHGKLLRRRKIHTTIIPETNNPVIFGESSHLDDENEPVEKLAEVKIREDQQSINARISKKAEVKPEKKIVRRCRSFREQSDRGTY